MPYVLSASVAWKRGMATASHVAKGFLAFGSYSLQIVGYNLAAATQCFQPKAHILGPKLFFVTGLVIFVTAAARLVCPDLLG